MEDRAWRLLNTSAVEVDGGRWRKWMVVVWVAGAERRRRKRRLLCPVRLIRGRSGRLVIMGIGRTIEYEGLFDWGVVDIPRSWGIFLYVFLLSCG